MDKETTLKELYGKVPKKELAAHFGVTTRTIRKYAQQYGIAPLPAGPPRIPFEEQMVQVVTCVKRKNYTKALLAAREATKEFRV